MVELVKWDYLVWLEQPAKIKCTNSMMNLGLVIGHIPRPLKPPNFGCWLGFVLSLTIK